MMYGKNKFKFLRTYPGFQKRKAILERTGDDRPKGSENNVKNENAVSEPVSLTVDFFISDQRRRDLDGSLATVLDCLVGAGVLADDNSHIVRQIHVHRIDTKKGEERVEVEIKRL